MLITSVSDGNFDSGRSSAEITCALRTLVASGGVQVGQFLPSETEMVGKYAVSKGTIRRALRELAREKLIGIEPRRGYRVLGRANNPGNGCPLAFVNWSDEPSDKWNDIHADLLTAIKAETDRRGWPLLALGSGGMRAAELIQRVRESRAFALVVSAKDPDLLAELGETGIPLLMLDEWQEAAPHDSVMQDGHQGGVMAARYLLGMGCKRIAWLGPVDRNAHSLARFGGASAQLAAEGQYFMRSLVREAVPHRYHAEAYKLLTGPNRPDGIIALWFGAAQAVASIAQNRNLELGRDLQLVGWCREEQYERDYVPLFRGGVPAPAVTWSVRTMAQAAIARVYERWDSPGMPPLQVRVPVKLRYR